MAPIPRIVPLLLVLSALPVPGMARQNRLARELSPYLLQHKDNPVDWYPWGDEAFAAARAADKPIFLSIGYATCHWCHVMEHESFEDEAVAALMNETFISIKVDREERPDIDNLYMTVCQLTSRSCGWPLNVVLTPDLKPFFVATYIPRESRFGRAGMLELIPRLKQVWAERRADVEASAGEITRALRSFSDPAAESAPPEAAWLDTAFRDLAGRYDAEHGGFGQAPKFPTPQHLLFLLRYWHRSGEAHALEMVTHTLDRMRLGGVYDHVGGGFHRYATDATWTLPHFEKMLYDQALLTMAYTEAYQATGQERYAQTAREVLAYVLRDMTDPEGGFHSAEDADSEGEEGKFYVWTQAELAAALGDNARWLMESFQVRPDGNFLDEATRRKTGANILYLTRPLDGEAARAWPAAREALFAARAKRVHPGKDDKVLTDWNGLMIAALARAGQVLDDPALTAAAERAATFLLSRMRRPDGSLLHRWRNGHAGIEAHLDDYAFLVWGLIELYEATWQPRWLSEALDLTRIQRERFGSEEGGYYFTAAGAERLLIRRKEAHEGALPSGNAVALWNLLRLGRMTGDTDLEAEADRLAHFLGGYVQKMPSAFTGALLGLDFAVGPTHEVVIAGASGAADTGAFRKALRSHYLPAKVVVFRPEGEGEEAVSRLAPYTANQHALDGKATAYVCEHFVCNRPTTDVGTMLRYLGVTGQ